MPAPFYLARWLPAGMRVSKKALQAPRMLGWLKTSRWHDGKSTHGHFPTDKTNKQRQNRLVFGVVFFLNQVSFPGNNCFLFFFCGVFQGLWRKMKMLFKEIVVFLFFVFFLFCKILGWFLKQKHVLLSPKYPLGWDVNRPNQRCLCFTAHGVQMSTNSHLFMTKNQTTFSSFWSWSAIFSSQKLEQKQGIQYTNQADLEALWLPSCKVSFSQLFFCVFTFLSSKHPNKKPSKWHISRHPRWHLDVHISNKPPIEQPTHFAVWQWGRFT